MFCKRCICFSERGGVGCDQRFSVHGRHGHTKNGAAQTQNGVRNQPERLENSAEHTGVSGNHTEQAGKTTDRRGRVAVTLDSQPDGPRGDSEDSR